MVTRLPTEREDPIIASKGFEKSGTGKPPATGVGLRGWPVVAVMPVLIGALWLWLAARHGVSGSLVGGLPGMLLLGTGLSNLLWTQDGRVFQFMALGAGLGTLLSLPAGLIFGPASLVLLAGSAVSFLAVGYLAIGQQPMPPGVPAPKVSPKLAFNAARDEAAMCGIVLTTSPIAIGRNAIRIRREIDAARTLFDRRGWLRKPTSYHRTPPPIENPKVQEERYKGWGFEHLTFESGYEPWPQEPGRERWMGYEANRTAHAYVLRHPGPPRPWLVCVHGIRMGSPRGGFGLFRPDHLHDDLGLNLLLPILPLHGPRRVGPVSGDRILAGDAMDSLHAGAQAMWDIRRMMTWLRESQDAPAIGVLGESLGGYAAALLSSLDNKVDCVVVCNPAVAPSSLFWSNALALTTHYLTAAGVNPETMAEVLRPVSPLALEPLVPKERRAVFAGVADRVVTAAEASALWHHWNTPRIAWFQGTHRGFLSSPQGRALLAETLRSAGM